MYQWVAVAVGISYEGFSFSRPLSSEMTQYKDIYEYMEREARAELDEIIIVNSGLCVHVLNRNEILGE